VLLWGTWQLDVRQSIHANPRFGGGVWWIPPTRGGIQTGGL